MFEQTIFYSQNLILATMWITHVWESKCGDVDKFMIIGYLKGFFTLVAHIFTHIR